jgi:hypothetical protein
MFPECRPRLSKYDNLKGRAVGFKIIETITVGRGDEANSCLSQDALNEQIKVTSAEQDDFFDEHLNGAKPSTVAVWGLPE